MAKNYDVIIAGTGAGGLYSAINLPSHLKILLITKRELILCNSALAQGGIAAVYKPEDDNIQLHTKDTLIAGGYKNNPDSLKILVTEAAHEIEEIIGLGVDFDKDENGSYHRTLEGGHSRHRIFHHKDATGFEITSKLQEAVKKMPNVDIMENALLCSVKKTGTGFSADISADGEHGTYNARFVILATGGIGRVYDYTTNSAIATGDGITIAYEMGAQIKNLSLIQFHPTAFNNKHTRECFLISEAVRGEGAYLLNKDGERFMQNYDERLELAPRDVVSHSIISEGRRLDSDDFYLDISYKDPEFIKNRFPMIYKYLLEQGIDMTKDRIPIYPCQHYLMGGINVNTKSQTTIDGLYAVGECSHTGVHGNNRLASNSLLEALVFGRQAALNIAERIKDCTAPLEELESAEFNIDPNAPEIPTGIRTEIRHIMQKSYFVIPDMQEALKGFERVSELKRMLEEGNYKVDHNYVEAKSIATVAYLILKEVI
ncbi:MAG: L-aspartate oxidase [Oscillospiraceae bacterium]|nr:L-aspartate oxidase [Oscillospiraceae bacterium]